MNSDLFGWFLTQMHQALYYSIHVPRTQDCCGLQTASSKGSCCLAAFHVLFDQAMEGDKHREQDVPITIPHQEHSWELICQPLRIQYKLHCEVIHRALLILNFL